MELLCIAVKITEELLGIFGLFVVLLFLSDDVTELIVAELACTSSVVRFDTLIMVSVTAHEVNGWEGQWLLAAITLFWIEVFCLSLQIFYLLSHILNIRHVFFYLLVVFSSDSILYLKSVDQVVLNDTEFQIGSALQNLKNK